MDRPMITRSRLLYAAALALAAVCTFLNISVASPQGITVFAPYVADALPLNDPSSALWQRATAIDVPLSAQNVTRPMLLTTSARSVTVRALSSGTQVALLIEWADDTQNNSAVAVQDFRDAVAVQFPLVDYQPFFCMGQQGGGVNIWHWKANWQADMLARQDVDTRFPNMYVDMYPFADDPDVGALYLPARYAGNLFASETRVSPVESLVAGGFGSLTSVLPEEQDVQGYGQWNEGSWRVILSRDLAPTAAYTDLSFAPGKVYPLAFAVWDGANNERGGQKSTSQWLSLQLEQPPAAAAAPTSRPAAAVARPPAAPAPAARVPAIIAPSTEILFAMGAGMVAVSLLCLIPLAGVILFYKLTDKSS